jgi:hypothetical protein
MDEIIFLVEESEEGGYIAKALGQAIVTEADSMAGLKTAVIEAVHCHFDDDGSRPKMIRLHVVKDEVFAV